jgi:uncharacterized protein YcgI (DUF1989 family)
MSKASVIAVPAGQAWAGIVRRGSHLRIRSRRVVHLVAFDNANRRDRLDDSRTKGNAARMFVTGGSRLISKFNRDLLQIVEDNSPPWSHDFLTGLTAEIAVTEDSNSDWSRLSRALVAHGIRPQEIPTTLNFFARVTIDGQTGRITVQPDPLDYFGEVELRAEVGCLVGLCVSSRQPGPAEGAELTIFQANALAEETSPS